MTERRSMSPSEILAELTAPKCSKHNVDLSERGKARHGAGAAKQALDHFGAQYYIGEGITGKCYAFPTLDKNFRQRTREELEVSRDQLYIACAEHPTYKFLLTKVGCGLGGYEEAYMRSLFNNPPHNLILPDEWKMS